MCGKNGKCCGECQKRQAVRHVNIAMDQAKADTMMKHIAKKGWYVFAAEDDQGAYTQVTMIGKADEN